MIKIIHIIFILIAFTVSAHSENYEYQKLSERIKAVNELIEEAKISNSLWRETNKLSNTAEMHAENNNYSLANKLIEEAEFQVKQGIQQSSDQNDINSLIPIYLQH